jgi:hypothetical protein
VTTVSDHDLDEIVSRYIEAAAAHGEATERGDSEAANKSADQVASAYKILREHGQKAQHKLLPLLNDPNMGVRLWAGSHALDFAPAEGERVLLSLQNQQSSLLGFSASMTLAQWRQGKLKFP